ncbi:hypothetical protein QQS21_006785 [Conoideocrella luteorostrata]|uniref:BTB domain-containing protein n=1 Tax=Conoideocrella luteorostrata TaxID=1105319 RepID=A0AAJ0CMC7_9HYPO|nr:hypothetical protein QQS21_006785 [Conoideocrella luteorostrata]
MSKPDIIFDEFGDVFIRVARSDELETTVNLVCSRALARTSPILQFQLQELFSTTSRLKESSSLERLVIEVPECDSEALTIFLNIAHAHFLDVPQTLGIDALYNLTIITFRFNNAGALAPWIHSWISAAKSNAHGKCIPKMLWVSWHVGQKNLFTNMAERMVMELSASEFHNARQLWGCAKSATIVDSVSCIRAQTLGALIDILGDMVQQLLVIEQKPKWSRSIMRLGSHGCRQVTYATIQSTLKNHGLWPLPQAAEVEESAVAFHFRIAGVMNHNHGGCEFSEYWTKKILHVLNSKSALLTELYEQHIGN